MEGYRWKHLSDRVSDAHVRNGLDNFPPYLMLSVSRYEIDQVTWTPKKIMVDVEVEVREGEEAKRRDGNVLTYITDLTTLTRRFATHHAGGGRLWVP